MWGNKQDENEKIERRKKLTLRNKVKKKDIPGGFRENIGMRTYLHCPIDYAKTLKLRFRVGDLDLSERRDIPVVMRRRKTMHRCGLVTKQKSVELT